MKERMKEMLRKKVRAVMMPRNETAVDAVAVLDTEVPDTVDTEDADADTDAAAATTDAATPTTATTATTTRCATITLTMCATNTDTTSTTTTPVATHTATNTADADADADAAEDTEELASENDLLSSLLSHTPMSTTIPQRFLLTSPKKLSLE